MLASFRFLDSPFFPRACTREFRALSPYLVFGIWTLELP